MLDLNGDGSQDLLAADTQGNVWVLFAGAPEQKPRSLTIAPSPNLPGPLTVTVSARGRRVGMHVVRPGVPVFVGRERPGFVTLEWRGRDGKVRTRKVMVAKPTRLGLGP
jgi:hypothetical protein